MRDTVTIAEQDPLLQGAASLKGVERSSFDGGPPNGLREYYR